MHLAVSNLEADSAIDCWCVRLICGTTHSNLAHWEITITLAQKSVKTMELAIWCESGFVRRCSASTLPRLYPLTGQGPVESQLVKEARC